MTSGCQWKLLPDDFPKWRTVYEFYRKWISIGFFDRLTQELNATARDSLRKSAQPSVDVIDSHSVRTGLEQSEKGIDGWKKIMGIKRHLAVDSNGFPLTIFISRANDHDSKKAIGLAIDTVCKYSTIRLLKADNGYRGPLVKTWKRDCLWNWSVWNRISAHRNSSRLAAGGLWNAPSRGLNLSDD